MVRDGNLPKPTKIPGTNLARWRRDDIERLIDGWFWTQPTRYPARSRISREQTEGLRLDARGPLRPFTARAGLDSAYSDPSLSRTISQRG